MITEGKAASALGAKTARACDSCLRIRARWFCAADDAFLCHGCDSLVHSANQLASRHERVRLQTASSKVNCSVSTPDKAWHSGFTRKARTPRHNKHLLVQKRPKAEEEEQVPFNTISTSNLPLVPELGSEEPNLDDDEIEEEHLLCRVPVFDPFDAQLCDIYEEVPVKNDVADEEAAFDLDKFSEFLPSHMDHLAGFAADVESLLGNGLDEDHSGDVKGSAEIVLGSKEVDEKRDHACVGAKGAMVMVKDDELETEATACHLEPVLDMTSDEAFDWNIDSAELPAAAEAALEEEEKTVVPVAACGGSVGEVGTNKRKILLRLNYEEVVNAWANQGSPWTTGNPPEFKSEDCWLDYLGLGGADVQCSYGEARSLKGHGYPMGSKDGGREARVSRYREKRRTRLFAKKIRYEVRKLNAEKRPRMKGRFVKRT